jgi:hypothetical protein
MLEGMRPSGLWGALAAAAALGATGCGGSSGKAVVEGTSARDDVNPFGSASVTTRSSSSPTGDAVTPACAASIAAFANEMTAGSCTAVVRLDYISLEIKGFQIVCGPYASPSEAAARATAQQDTGFGREGESLAQAYTQDELVFWTAPSDVGGAAVVSARNGKSVFGGSTLWKGNGDITYPKTWRPTADIGPGCAPSFPGVGRDGYDLGSGQKLKAAKVNAALVRVWKTALVAGMQTNLDVIDAVVLLYTRSAVAIDRTTAEWIVLVNGGDRCRGEPLAEGLHHFPALLRDR